MTYLEYYQTFTCQAIAEMLEVNLQDNKNRKRDPANSVSGLFTWYNTPQREDFWGKFNSLEFKIRQ